MKHNEEILAGISYGDSLSSPTVICIADALTTRLEIFESEEGDETDEIIIKQIVSKSAAYVFIDTPVTLPAGYCGGGDDFFYREADKELNLISPMQHGLVTARSIRLKQKLYDMANIELNETSPYHIAHEIGLQNYNKPNFDIKEILKELQEKIEYAIPHQQFCTKIHIHSLLALIAALRFKNEESKKYGRKKEGMIYV